MLGLKNVDPLADLNMQIFKPIDINSSESFSASFDDLMFS